MLRAVAVRRASEVPTGEHRPTVGRAVLPHDERHLRRRAIDLIDGRKVLVDLAEPVVLANGDFLVIEGNGEVEITAASEPLYEIVGQDPTHLTELSWHIGNRHLPADVGPTRILIQRDHVIKAMLEGLGATVKEVDVQFHPVRGAYSSHGEHSHEAHDLAEHRHDSGHTHGDKYHGDRHSHGHEHDPEGRHHP